MSRTAGQVVGRVSILVIIVVAVAAIALLIFGSQFFYLFVRVEQQEVGVQFESGKIAAIVGPGVYSDFGLYVELKKVSSQAIPFNVRDEEIITADKQRIGLVVTGDAFRPNLARIDVLQEKWAQYSGIYLNDDFARERVQALAQQAMKVCVGERTFDDAIIGTARDVLRACIDEELSKLADNYGLQIENVVVPEVVLSPEKAAQDKLKADAEAAAEQAKQEGEIRVQQSRIQEEARQQTILAQLEQEKLQAQKAVIEAQKANDLLAAQQDLAINQALALAAAEKAKVDIAQQLALAQLYSANPLYLQLQLVLANASALKATDKIIFTPEGTTPTIVLPGPGIVPTVETGVTP